MARSRTSMMQVLGAVLRTRWFVCAALGALCGGPVAGTTIDDLCSPAADPCVVIGTHPVDSGSLIDAGTRELRVEGRLDVASGSMTLRAGLLSVSGELRAMGTSSMPGGKIIADARVIQLDGAIDARGAPGGMVTLTATQAVQVDGTVTVDSRSGDYRGGTIAVGGDTIAITGALSARGGNDSSGGDVTITARADVDCDGSIDTSGGDGGNIELSAAAARTANLTLTPATVLRSDATFGGCDGGDITLQAGGLDTPDADVVMQGQLISNGRSGNDEDGGGSGGAVTISATGDVVMMGSAARLTASGASPDGSGGDVSLSASGTITVGCPIDVAADGNDGSGGSLSVDAGGSVELAANVSASGDSGGSIEVISAGSMLRVQTRTVIDARADGGGSGGDIVLRSDAALLVDGTLRADGPRAAGATSVELRACALRVEGDGVLSSLGSQSSNVLIGRDETVIAGRLRADPDSGRNELRFPSVDRRPEITAGASIQPPAEEIVDPRLGSCDEPTASPSPTATGTPVATRTPTATRLPRHTPGEPCLGDCDNDGRVTIGELVTLVASAKAESGTVQCAAGDRDGNGRITIDELVAAVISALTDCS